MTTHTGTGAARPVRLQLSRKKGFDLQAVSLATNGLPAVVVARPTMWGNPYPVINTGFAEEHQDATDSFRRLFKRAPSHRRHLILTILKGNDGRGEAAVARMRANLSGLRGKNLACWCAPGLACHADILLELANAPLCVTPTPDAPTADHPRGSGLSSNTEIAR